MAENERLVLTDAMREKAAERLGDKMEMFERLLTMSVADMTAVDRFNLVMCGALASGLNADALPDSIFGDEASYVNDTYYVDDNFGDDVSRDLFLISLAPLNAAIKLDHIVGAEADRAMGEFMALRHELTE